MAVIFPEKEVGLGYHISCTLGIKKPNGYIDTRLSANCIKAKVGGRNGYAYNVSEAGGSDGLLIEGAQPYHNIFSTNGPSEWKLPASTTGEVYNRLKRDSSNHYRYDIRDFRRYNHNARGVGQVYFTAQAQQYEGSQYHKEITFHPEVTVGDYDWRQITADGATLKPLKVGIMIDRTESGDPVYYSDPITLTGQSSIQFPNISFEVNTTYVRTYNYPTRLILYTNNNTKCGFLPGSGNIEITISAEPKKAELFINVDNGSMNIFVLKGSVQVEEMLINGTYRYNAPMDFSGKTKRELKKIEYVKYNRNTGSVVSSETITSGFANEGPKELYREETLIFANLGRVAPTATEWVKVIMYYE